jgi:PAS domain S-box-containing protein
MTHFQSVDTAELANVGRVLPDLFAVYDSQRFEALYVNPAGIKIIDPSKKYGLDQYSLMRIIGVNEVDRFNREIFPKTKVLGAWSGAMILRDLTGSEATYHVRLLDVTDSNYLNGQLLYLYACPATEEAHAESYVSDPEMLYALLETTPDSISFKDTYSRYIRISQAKARRHRLCSAMEAIGKTDFDFFNAEHAAKVVEEEKEVMRTGVPILGREEKVVYDDGSVAWASTDRIALRNRSGQMIGVFTVSRDITARKTAELQLHKREVMLRSTLLAAPIGIALVQDRSVHSVNALLCEMTGYNAEEVMGQAPRALYETDAEYERVGMALYDEKGNAGRTSIETVWRKKNGELVDVLLSAAHFENEDPGEWRILTALDITERKRVEERLRKLSRAVEQSPLSIVIMDSQRSIEYVNPFFEKSTGYTAAEMMGKKMDVVRSGLHPDEFYEELWGTLSAGKTWTGEYSTRKKNGEVLWERVAITGLHDEQGRITHYIGANQDITREKQDERERREMEARLQLSSKLESVGSLAAGVAHEINTPTQFLSDNIRFLTSAFSEIDALLKSYKELKDWASKVDGSGEIVKKVHTSEEQNELEYLTGEIPRCLEQSLDGLRRISKIVGSLKEFSHPGGEEKKKADLNKAIETTVAVSRHEWKYVADVVTELAPDLPPVFCVIDEINQALLNLVVNAAHAIEEQNKRTGSAKGVITIRTKQDGSYAHIEVQDTGTGIVEKARSHIFEPFYTTKPVGKGTGQGLAIVQAVIVKKHHGKINFTTELGKGTTFVLSLPISPELAPLVTGGSRAQQSANQHHAN